MRLKTASEVHTLRVPLRSFVRIVVRAILPVLALISLPACFPIAKVPVDTIWYPYKEGTRQECLIVFLPGKGDRAADFKQQGFINMARQAGLKADMVAVDLHFGYYLNQTALERLREDVIKPARYKGYRCLWLVGISMGGFGALSFETKYPEYIAGIILLSPYLGGNSVINEVHQAGGVRAWEPGKIEQSDVELRLWKWIKDYESGNRHAPIIFLGYGKEDRFALEDGLLARILEPDNVITTPGGHSWSTWKVLWESMLNTIFGMQSIDVKQEK